MLGDLEFSPSVLSTSTAQDLRVEEVWQAAARLAAVAHETPVVTSRTLARLTGNRVYLKLENQQRTGSFKLRGAFNKISKLPGEVRARGVVAASAGNHAQGVAYAAQHFGVPAVIVMPEGTPQAKVAATAEYGAEVVLAGACYDEACKEARRLEEERGHTFIHAFDDRDVIAGQGTVGMEFIQQLPELEVVLVPVGGGGLASGLALSIKSERPDVRVIGVQTASAPAAATAWTSGQVVPVPVQPTLAEGIAVERPGRLTWELMGRYLDDIIAVSERSIARAMLLLFERAKLVVEGAGAVGLAALLDGYLECEDKCVGIVVSGGNLDVTLASSGRTGVRVGAAHPA